MIGRHQGQEERTHSFDEVWEKLNATGPQQFSTRVGTPFVARASIALRGKKPRQRVIRYFQHGKEYGRCYPCCWHHYYNCNRTRIGMYSRAVDHSGSSGPATNKLTRKQLLRLIDANGGPGGLSLSGENLSGIDLGPTSILEELESRAHLDTHALPSWVHLIDGKRVGVNLHGVELDGANLNMAHLQRANLRGAHLAGATLRGAWLTQADLENADLVSADLRQANLQGASLTRASLLRADLSDAKLQAADLANSLLRDSRLVGARLQEALMSGTRLTSANLNDANLRRASLVDADLRDANLNRANLREARLTGARLEGAWLGGAKLERAALHDANLRRASLFLAKLHSAGLIGANLQRAQLRGAEMCGACLRGADLSGADLEAADLRGSSLEEANLQYAVLRNATLSEANMQLSDLLRAQATGANLEGADLRHADLTEADLARSQTLEGVFLSGAVIRATNLTREPLGQGIGEEHSKEYHLAKEAYLALKNNFESTGRYDDASWAYVKERKMEKMMNHPQFAGTYYQVAERLPPNAHWRTREWWWFYLRHTLKWTTDWLVEMICGYGESFVRVGCTLATVYFLFTLGYGLTWGVIRVTPGPDGATNVFTANPIDWAIFSLGALTTMEPAGLEPRNNLVQLAAGVEALLGIFLTGLLGFVVANRIRRS